MRQGEAPDTDLPTVDASQTPTPRRKCRGLDRKSWHGPAFVLSLVRGLMVAGLGRPAARHGGLRIRGGKLQPSSAVSESARGGPMPGVTLPRRSTAQERPRCWLSSMAPKGPIVQATSRSTAGIYGSRASSRRPIRKVLWFRLAEASNWVGTQSTRGGTPFVSSSVPTGVQQVLVVPTLRGSLVRPDRASVRVRTAGNRAARRSRR